MKVDKWGKVVFSTLKNLLLVRSFEPLPSGSKQKIYSKEVFIACRNKENLTTFDVEWEGEWIVEDISK